MTLCLTPYYSLSVSQLLSLFLISFYTSTYTHPFSQQLLFLSLIITLSLFFSLSQFAHTLSLNYSFYLTITLCLTPYYLLSLALFSSLLIHKRTRTLSIIFSLSLCLTITLSILSILLSLSHYYSFFLSSST